ncbi:MAG: RidA family protein [Promethearchaeota archaeon]
MVEEKVEKKAIDGGATYSAAIQAGNLLFISGQVPTRDNSTPENIREQTKISLDGVLSVLEKAGGKLSDLVKLTVYLTDIKDFPEFNIAYREFFEEHGITTNFPARATLAVAGLVRHEWKIEIEGYAYLISELNL